MNIGELLPTGLLRKLAGVGREEVVSNRLMTPRQRGGLCVWCIVRVSVYGVSGVSAVLYGFNGMVRMVYFKGISVWCGWYQCCTVWV